jgi:mRNA interferase MazF
MNIERYGIYLANLNPTQGGEMNKIRPVVVVSMDEMNAALQTVVICPLTTSLHPRWRSRIQVKCSGKPAEIAVDQIRAISKDRLGKRIDTLTTHVAADLRNLISEMYGE